MYGSGVNVLHVPVNEYLSLQWYAEPRSVDRPLLFCFCFSGLEGGSPHERGEEGVAIGRRLGGDAEDEEGERRRET